jgi:uncharacterized membrane protein
MSQPNQLADDSREVGRVVFAALLGGLAFSVVLLLTGVVLAVASGQGLPDEVPPFGELFEDVMALRPAGFLALGLIALMLTPLLRVLGTFIISLVERDWTYVLVTGMVLAIMIGSILLGKG